MNTLKTGIALSGLLMSSAAFSAEPSNNELLDLIQKQQKQIQELQNQTKKTEKKAVRNDEKIESSITAIEQVLDKSSNNKTKIGGYGELHYNNIEEDQSIDFHRFVLFISHEFSDTIRFVSEFELEHALSGSAQPGEVELEQAYVEIDLTDITLLKSGVFLVPVGITNETHEPPSFYGVERNPVEKNIIPSTWWEAGAAISTQLSKGVTADFAIHSGLSVPTSGNKSFLIRSGRQKAAKANADSLAYTARIKYSAIPGLELAASYQHQTDVTQGSLDANANLFSAHISYTNNNFGLKALYATWKIDSSIAEAVGRDHQTGYYIEPSYKINENFGLFARYNAWDNNAGNSLETEKEQSNVGLNYWPHEDVVFKVDFENRSGAHDGKGFNLGVGYQF